MLLLDLFAGIGGASTAAHILEIETGQFVEIDPQSRMVLSKRFPKVPIHDDIRTYTPSTKRFNIVWSSFPCTGTSCAGKRTGLAHPASALWIESIRVFEQSKAEFLVIEQPEGFINNGLRTVLGRLRLGGYKTEIEIVSAAELGAVHRRNRVFVVAYPYYVWREGKTQSWSEQIRNDIATVRAKKFWTSYTDQQRCAWKQWKEKQPPCKNQTIYSNRAEALPGSIGVDDGLPSWLGGRMPSGWWAANRPPERAGVSADRHKKERIYAVSAYGKAVAPQQALIPLMRVKYLLETYCDEEK